VAARAALLIIGAVENIRLLNLEHGENQQLKACFIRETR
jgi:hypothetical protein